MWTCPNCGEHIEKQFDACWNCGTSVEGARPEDFACEESVSDDKDQAVEITGPPPLPGSVTVDEDVAPKNILNQILSLQEQQQEALRDIQGKVGCLFMHMVAGIVLSILAFLVMLFR